MSAQTATSSNSSSAKDDLRDQAQTIAGDVKELGSISKRAAEEAAEAAKQRARAAKEDAVNRAHEVEDELVRYIREQPVKSVLIAAGVGALASMWLRR
ncbi:hypothetical protein Poly30_46510 [Planctomycetes bacterium Poly30]|uniref:DUF883 domain-containing protein n=1 Tax=Saltatorellus ferox TaxID=2528018 RepID=A0A518EYC5_9BACT|nr:hypothetical protein Poly30_46510 [Planctomycetes bacterium Poly30]